MSDIPKELLGKKIVMSPEMFVSEFSNVIFSIITELDKLNATMTKDACRDYMIRYLKNLYKININSKLDDPEEIQ